MTDAAVLHRGRCGCGWVGAHWTESYTDAADAAWLHAEIEDCDGEWSVETEWPTLIVESASRRTYG
jgi:hypothetical protein